LIYRSQAVITAPATAALNPLLRRSPASYSIDGYGRRDGFRTIASRAPAKPFQSGSRRKSMARALLIVGFLALAIGLLWIGQGTGAIAWPRSSFMINQLQWAGYGAVLGAVGLILIWQGKS
jgi:hypothetical protein